MPLNAIDYSKTIIYKIKHKEKPELFYIGHTTNFDSRKYQHKTASDLTKANGSTEDFYNKIRANGGWSQFDMTPIKQLDCKNRIGALIEEQRTIDEMKPTMNKNPAYKPLRRIHRKKSRLLLFFIFSFTSRLRCKRF